MIVACDNAGRLYVALTQCNTDADLYMLFLSKLVAILGREDANFRENTLFVMDSASVHRDAATRQHFANLRLRVALAAPYGYQTMVSASLFPYPIYLLLMYCQAVEYVYANFKSVDINPEQIATGKSKWLRLCVKL